jgi:hypothetical protein
LATTTIPPDWKEFLSALLSENTKFLLIGAHALAFHVEGRLTEDLDVFVEPSEENAVRVHQALVRFGFGNLVTDPTLPYSKRPRTRTPAELARPAVRRGALALAHQ